MSQERKDGVRESNKDMLNLTDVIVLAGCQ